MASSPSFTTASLPGTTNSSNSGPATGTPATYGTGITDRLINEFLAQYPGWDLKIEPIQLKVDSTLFSTNLGNDIYVLLSTVLDIPSYYRLQIYSHNNYLRTSKADFESNVQNNAQAFRGTLKIVTENYGATTAALIPFNLMFAKLTFTKQKNEPAQTEKTNPFRFLQKQISNLFKSKQQ